MSTSTTPAQKTSPFKNPEFIAKLHELRKPDNWRNWLYILRAYVILALVIVPAIWFFVNRAAWGLSFWWNVPVSLAAIIVIGACQHQLAALAHEATHYALFKNKKLNELAADLLCLFPALSTTYFFRLQHLAHHQFVNDEEQDPDVSQLKESGHWLDFPVEKSRLIKALLRWMWLPKLILYSAARARRASSGGGKNPYRDQNRRYSKVPKRVMTGSVLLQVALAVALVLYGNTVLLAAVPAAI